MDIIIFFLDLLVLACDCTHPAGCTSWSLGSFCRGTWRFLQAGEVGAPFQYFTAAIAMFIASADQCSSWFHLKMPRLNHRPLDQRRVTEPRFLTVAP
ncbi:hypothetical protein PVAP13_7NG322150 [Panicum virgatum]|uniref:Secreted protein n=1 Tax=Panicum virgatum TaxID=38727 RepID=A0A8T0Q304_PANVG|nr:hypothetical protein PVAP13_7NG322150 [Panicum virgatum]